MSLPKVYKNFVSRREKKRRKRRNILAEGNIWSAKEKKNEEGNAGKYLENEIILFVEKGKYGEGKGRKYLKKDTIGQQRKGKR